MQEVAFLRVRIIQSVSELKALGFFYSLLLLSVAAALLSFYYQSQTTQVSVVIGSGFVILAAGAIHFTRNDHQFLFLAVSRPYRILFFEYLSLVLPFTVLSFIKSGQLLSFLPILFVPVISAVNVSRRTYVEKIRSVSMFPVQNFEWTAGVRHTGILFWALWILAFALVMLPFASLIVLWFLLLMISSFYDQGEPVEMIESFRLDSGGFLRKKMSLHCMSFITPALPIVSIAIIFNPDRWWVYLLFLIFSLLNISVFIVSKYSVWHHKQINRSNSIVNALCMIGLFLPFLLPLPLIVFVKNYRKAVNNLNPLLDDYR